MILEITNYSKNYIRYDNGKNLLIVDLKCTDETKKIESLRFRGIVELCILCESPYYCDVHMDTLKQAIELDMNLFDIIDLFDMSQIWTQTRWQYDQDPHGLMASKSVKYKNALDDKKFKYQLKNFLS